MAKVNRYDYDPLTAQYNTLRIVDYNAQRLENANIAANLLRDFDTEKYPCFAKYLDQRNHNRRYRINCILEYLGSSDRNSFYIDEYDRENKSFTCIPYQQLTKLYNGSNSTYAQVINFMLLAGMLEKFDPARDQNRFYWLTEWAEEYRAHNRHKRPAIYYHLPKWDQDTLAAAEQLASDRNRLKTLLNVIDAAGQEEAQEIYDTDRRIPDNVAAARRIMEDIAAGEIMAKGYTTQRELIRKLKQTRRKCLQKLKLKQLVKDYTQTLCDTYCWRYGRPTKQQIEQWNLRKRNGEPDLEWIICPERSDGRR